MVVHFSFVAEAVDSEWFVLSDQPLAVVAVAPVIVVRQLVVVAGQLLPLLPPVALAAVVMPPPVVVAAAVAERPLAPVAVGVELPPDVEVALVAVIVVDVVVPAEVAFADVSA